MKNKSVIGISIISIGIGVALGYVWGSGSATTTTETMSIPKDALENMEGMHMMPEGSMLRNVGPEFN